MKFMAISPLTALDNNNNDFPANNNNSILLNISIRA